MAKDLYIPVSIRGGRLEAKAQLGQTVVVKEGPEKYTPAPITPSESQQTIPTKDKQLTADVVVEPIPSEYIVPTGTETISITENGTVSRDISDKETVTVNVDVPAPQPTGTKSISITENGTTVEDVSGYANAEISVDIKRSWEYEWDYATDGGNPPLFLEHNTIEDAGDSMLIKKPELYFPFGEAELELVAKMGNTVSYLPQIGVGTSLNRGFKWWFQDGTGAVRSNISGSAQNYTSDNTFHTVTTRFENGNCVLTIDGNVITGLGVTASACLSGIGKYGTVALDNNASIYIKSIKYRRL